MHHYAAALEQVASWSFVLPNLNSSVVTLRIFGSFCLRRSTSGRAKLIFDQIQAGIPDYNANARFTNTIATIYRLPRALFQGCLAGKNIAMTDLIFVASRKRSEMRGSPSQQAKTKVDSGGFQIFLWCENYYIRLLCIMDIQQMWENDELYMDLSPTITIQPNMLLLTMITTSYQIRATK